MRFTASTIVHYQVEERYVFDTSQPGVGAYLAVLLPKSDPYQRVEDVAVSWPGNERRIPKTSVEIILLDGVTGLGGVLEATITYDVALPQGRVSWQAPVNDAHLQPEPEIESDAPELVRQATPIGADPSRDGIYEFYSFMADHLSWPTKDRIGKSQSVLAAYRSGVGVCGEHANLMTALCRASGIPAKSIGGLRMPGLLLP